MIVKEIIRVGVPAFSGYRNHIVRLSFCQRFAFITTIVFILLVIQLKQAYAQDPSPVDSGSVIATSTNLSAALPATEWGRVESSVDRGLQWLASQQTDDGSFPSDEDRKSVV